MINRLTFLLLALVALVAPSMAHAGGGWPIIKGIYGSSASPACGSSGLPDGCTSSPMLNAGNFQNASFFSQSANVGWQYGQLQSAQASLAVQPAWNVAGVSGGYSLGIKSTVFTGSISGTTLTVSSIQTGSIAVGMTLDELHGVQQGTHILSGSGSTWTVDKSQTVASQTLYAMPLVSPDSGITGCTYYGVGNASSLNGAVATLNCGSSATLSYVDFSPSNRCADRTFADGCKDGRATLLYLSGSSKNYALNYVKMSADAYSNGGSKAAVGNSFQLRISGTASNVTITGGIFDGCGSPDPYCAVGFNNYIQLPGTNNCFAGTDTTAAACGAGPVALTTWTGNWISKYAMWVNVNGRFVTRSVSGAGDTIEWSYNYICGIAYGPDIGTGLHGQLDLLGSSAVTVASYTAQYNTLCQPANVLNNQDGMVVTANIYSGQSFIDGFAAGSLGPLQSVSGNIGQTAYDGLVKIPAGATVTAFGTGTTGSVCNSGATAQTATCMILSAPATGSGSASVMVYGGNHVNNATTGLITPWGANASLLVNDVEVIGNTYIVNQSPLGGGSAASCTRPPAGTLGVYGPCFATTGTGLFELNGSGFGTYGTVNVSGNYGVLTGSFFAYNIPTATAVASVTGGTATLNVTSATGEAAGGTLPVGWWVVDSTGTGLGGGPPLTITSSASGTGPWTYSLSGTVPTTTTGFLYIRQAVVNAPATNNKTMNDGATCNPPGTAANDTVCTGYWRSAI